MNGVLVSVYPHSFRAFLFVMLYVTVASSEENTSAHGKSLTV